MTYTPLNPDASECDICGAVVADTAAHDAWHAEQDGTDPEPPDPPDPPDPGPELEPAENVERTNGFFPGSFGSWDGNPTDADPNRFDHAESQLNRAIPFTTVMLDQGGQDADYKKMVGSAHFLVDADRIWTYHDRIIPIVSVPLAWRYYEGSGPRPTYADALNDTIDGRYDDEFVKVATISESDGKRSLADYSEIIWRLGWELNGEWPDWSSRNGNHDLFIAAWQRITAILRENTPTAHRMMWCLMESQWQKGFGPEAWPGDEWVDIVNADHYRREDKRPSIDALRSIAQFAEDHGKLVSFAEWGFGSDTPKGEEGVIVDDGEWVDMCADFYAELGDQLHSQVPFSPGDRDWLDAKTMPNVNERWRARFGAPA